MKKVERVQLPSAITRVPGDTITSRPRSQTPVWIGTPGSSDARHQSLYSKLASTSTCGSLPLTGAASPAPAASLKAAAGSGASRSETNRAKDRSLAANPTSSLRLEEVRVVDDVESPNQDHRPASSLTELESIRTSGSTRGGVRLLPRQVRPSAREQLSLDSQ